MSNVRTGAGYTPTDPQHVATKQYVDLRAAVPVYVQQTVPTGLNVPTVFEWWQTDASGNVVGHWLYP